MNSWRELAARILNGEHDRTDRHETAMEPAIVPIVPIVPILVPPDPATLFEEWGAAIGSVDRYQAPPTYPPAHWLQLCDDAEWLLGTFGEQAARFGWSTADLFGLWPVKPHWGGVADRLRGARSLIMDADRSHWRTSGQVERFNRGSYPALRPFWDPIWADAVERNLP